MISKYDIIREFKNAEKNNKKLSIKMSNDENSILDSKTEEFICSMDTFLTYLRRQYHCDFETIYSEHVTLTEIYRCRECGTVIFSGDDEYHYNPNEKCPVCCHDDSVCYNEYWTKDQIESDPEKQKIINAFIEEQARMNRHYERREKRNGLYDWQRWQKKFKTKNHGIEITMICFGYDGDTGNIIGHADRYLEIYTWKLSDGIVNHHIQIPMSWYNIYIRWIYPYIKKWQKNKLKKE